MRHRLATSLILFAWLLATGSQWDLVQTVAWGRMFAGYAQTMNLAAAAQRTFDADLPCELCKAVSKAKQQQNSAIPEGKFGSKVLLIFQPASSVVYGSREKSNWFRDEHRGLSAEQPAPPCPPPRGAAA